MEWVEQVSKLAKSDNDDGILLGNEEEEAEKHLAVSMIWINKIN